MDIEQFYDEDERRRTSAEIEIGTEWTDSQGIAYELNWIEDTGELYLMCEPPPKEWADPFGGIYLRHAEDVPPTGMQVALLGTVASHDALEAAIAGWQEAMGKENSLAWLHAALATAGIAPPR